MSNATNPGYPRAGGTAEFPRQFVAEDEVLDSWEKIAPYFDELGERPLTQLVEVGRNLLPRVQDFILRDELPRKFCGTPRPGIAGIGGVRHR